MYLRAQEKGVPGARFALRVDQLRLSSTLSTGALIQRTVFKLSFLLFQCLFLFLSDFPSKPSLSGAASMGLATAYGPFRPAVYHLFVLREAG